MRQSFFTPLFLALSFAALACSGDDSSSTTANVGTGGVTAAATGDGATSAGDGDGSTANGDMSATAAETGAETSSCPNTPQPDGGGCTEDCECESESCFFIAAIGGICGECKGDDDCEGGGCSIPNPLAEPPTGAFCSDGSNGTGCETDAACADGLSCGTLLEAPGILTLATCGECLVDGDCDNGQLCSPTIDIGAFTGELLCVDPGTVPNGQACDHLGTGSDACESGICATIDVMSVIQIGVCGECDVDADCMDKNMMCADPDLDDMMTVIPPMCVPIR